MNMADKTGVIWFDGEMLPWADARVHVLTHSLHYGMGFFEGIRAYTTEEGPAIFRLQDHLQRFFNSAKILNMPMHFDQKTLELAHIQLAKENKLAEVYFRPLCFYGAEGMGLRVESLKTHVAIAAWEWGAYLGEGLEKGVRVCISSYARHAAKSMLVKAKATGPYITSTLAAQEAKAAGYDEALLLDQDGFVAEGSGENFFMVKDGKLYTPLDTNILEGITRATIMTLAKDLDIEVIEKRITRDQVYCADEAFFTGTAAEVTPICSLDNRPIGEGKPGPMTTMLQTLYFDVVKGKKEKYKHWLTYVS